MKHYTHWERPEKVKEGPFPERRVETAGYVPPKMQIENLIQAGIRLDEFRKGHYQFGPEDEVPENMEAFNGTDPVDMEGILVTDLTVETTDPDPTPDTVPPDPDPIEETPSGD